MARFIFVTGGVVSSLGKGIATASIGLILKSMGYRVTVKKLDPYLNIDPGTMNPSQHGEVFVTEDGSETDLDLGHYERFIDIETTKFNNITAGKIYKNLIEKERRGDYLGKTVQVIPHVTDLIKQFIRHDESRFDFILCEIGGTVGDIEALPFFEASRQIKQNLPEKSVLFVHLTLVPYLGSSKEIKTKPTQHSVKELMSIGIIPDILICRSSVGIGKEERAKIASFCNVSYESVIDGIDVDYVYEVPLRYVEQGIDKVILGKFNISGGDGPNLEWLQKVTDLSRQIKADKNVVNVGIVGKYINYKDSYKSLIEAVEHAGLFVEKNVKIIWIDAKKFEKGSSQSSEIAKCNAIIIAGGFGLEGLDGKIQIIKYARENKIPFLGICLGMQMAVIEFCRNVLNIKNATSQEMLSVEQLKTISRDDLIVGIMEDNDNIGGTMRLGAYKANILDGTLASNVYSSKVISERHRHRYEVSTEHKNKLEDAGMIVSGISLDGKLPEIVELKNHPFFIACQFHPEFKSRINKPHPLFVALIKACTK